MEIDISKIKLIIWDLDQTFWNGTISEGEVIISEQVINLIKNSTNCGVINSICSKNNLEVVENKLKEVGLNDYFVFKSINWEPKGQRIKEIITDMSLRDANVLFLDDNESNLQEAIFYNQNLMVETPDYIHILADYFEKAPKKDLKHSRLEQYKTLEVKRVAERSYSSNYEFLMASNIQCVISRDVKSKEDRLYELMMRSNQLNYTKYRQSKEEFNSLINDCSIDKGYVEVADNYGYYGIVGFFAIKDGQLIHFLFSCRTLGMKLEQYVYKYLESPSLKVVGDVACNVSSTEGMPEWINLVDKIHILNDEKSMNDILIKGPCDLYRIVTFLKSNDIKTEFAFIDDQGRNNTFFNTLTNTLASKLLSEKDKKEFIEKMPFGTPTFFDTKFFDNNKFIIVSVLQEKIFNFYRHKKLQVLITLGNVEYDLTNLTEEQENLVFNNPYNFSVTREQLKWFKENFELVPFSSNLVINTIEKLIKMVNSNIVFILGNEKYIQKGKRAVFFYPEINNYLKSLSLSNNKIKVIDVSKYIESMSDLMGPYDYDHYSPKVYYKISNELLQILNSNGEIVKKRSKLFSFIYKAKRYLKKLINKKKKVS